MPVEDKFITMGLKRVELERYLEETLGRAGYAGVEIRRLPIGTRVTLYVERPGMVIGRKGRSINVLTEELEKRFGLEKPQVEVVEVQNPELCAPIMAKRIAFAIERGINIRRIGYQMLRRIMNAGARGVEIVIAGKIAGERKKRVRFYQGYICKTGELAEKHVSRGYATAMTKPGVIGVKVFIMPPDVPLPDEIKLPEAQPQQEAEATEVGDGGQSEAQ
jgi:small subunit ribosomal protein S3